MCHRLVYTIILTLLLISIAGAQSPYDRAAYWDGNYGTAWAGDGSAVRDALEQAGYTIVDAAQLKTWMDGHIADRALSVVVFCRDAVPDTVAETQDASCTMRQYLEAGGKIVWYSDIPCYYQTTAGGTNTTWGDAGSLNTLGWAGSSATRDSGNTVTITEAGLTWGLTSTWASTRPTLPDAWPNMTILAEDDAGNACAWAAHYLPGDTFRGFVRLEDHTGAPSDVANLIAVAEYAEFLTGAAGPVPAGGATDVRPDSDLTWVAGAYAATHDVYFGTDFEDVNDASRTDPRDVLVSQDQTETTYEVPGGLDIDMTYYWRIDEVNGAPDFTVFKGDVWSFSTEPFAYRVEGVVASSNTTSVAEKMPQKVVDGSGMNADGLHSVTTTDMWEGLPSVGETPYIQFDFDRVYKLHEMRVWNYNMEYEFMLGIGLKDVTVEYTEDGQVWTALGDYEFAQAPSSAQYAYNTVVGFDGIAAQAVRVSIHSRWGTMSQLIGLSEVRFMYIPAFAREPQPADGATGVAVETPLSWRPGRGAVSHEIYLGTDPNALTMAGTAAEPTYTPAALDLDTTYSWQVVEVADGGASWAGDVWSFTTQTYIEIDGFESYDDDFDNGTAIFQTWIDGYEDTANGGSFVGNDPSPYAELTIVHSGSQSMPLFFDNGSTLDISETDRNFPAGQNWAAGQIKSLSFWFHGAEGNTGQLYAKVNGTKVLYDGPAINIARPAWQLWSIDLATLGNLTNVTQVSIGVQGVGSGVMYIDDVRLYPEVLEYLSPGITGPGDTVVGVPNDADWPAAEYPDLAIDSDTSTKFLHFKGATEPTGIQITPLAGSTVVTEMTLTTANDHADRDPIAFELYGSNAGIDGPYTLIASGDIVDFAGATEWPRFTQNTTPITFDNSVAYRHYQILFTAVRDPDVADSMQIAEITLLGTIQ